MTLILQIVKTLLLPSFNISDDILIKYIDVAYNEACGYCNRIEMPKESYNNIAFLCVANLKSDYKQNITSMAEGGRSVNFDNSTHAEKKEEALKGLKKWKIARVY